MALTGAERVRKHREKMRLLEAAKPTKEELQAREDQHSRDRAFAQEQDATGKFYLSECRPLIDLLAIYQGANILDKESEDDEVGGELEKKKKAKVEKKDNRPNPSQQRIAIRAIETLIGDQVFKLEPNCAFEYRTQKEVDGVISFRQWLDLRDKARKNLFWLGRLLGKGLFHETHQYVCDQFVQKNFDGLYFPGYTLDDFHEAVKAQKRYANYGTDVIPDVTETRELILLESRGAYKSTINGIDVVQWLINCPDIRVMFITAFKHLAKKLMKEVKGYFYLARKGEPTAFQMLFPEYILTGLAGRSKEPIECPARNLPQKESSLWVTSMESSSTGDHMDVLKGDDVVDPKNSADPDMRADLKFLFDSIKNDCLDPWGIVDITGTRYYTTDMYGARLAENPETKRISPIRYSCRGCWVLSPEDQISYNLGKLSLSEIINQHKAKLVFPYRLGWAKLRSILDEKDERGFKNQQLNQATDPNEDSVYINQFDINVLRAHTYQRAQAPKEMEIIQSWDFAYSDRRTSDFSVGITAGIYTAPNGQPGVVILEVILDKWKSSELSYQMLAFYEKYRPTKLYIEEANGMGFLMDNIKHLAQFHGSDIRSHISVCPVSVQPNAKRERIKNLEFLLGHDRLWFVSGTWIDETYKQLTQYTGAKSTQYRKDDVPDAMSLLLRHLPPTALIPNPSAKDIQAENEKRRADALRKAMYDRMFGNAYMPKGSESPKMSDWIAQHRGQPITPPTPEAAPLSPREQALQQLAKILPKGFRL
jgi:phage terminase large subunit-like protein